MDAEEKKDAIPAVKGAKQRQGMVTVTDSEGKAWQIGEPGPNDYVVKQWAERFENGGVFKVPNTAQVQTYNAEMYEKMIEDNYFEEANMGYEVIQEPSGE
jgi:hypothetical protein